MPRSASPSATRRRRSSAANYRALIFVNGWNMGQYIANVGPQHTFVIPNGVLNPDGQNTLALAVTSDGGPGNGLEKVALTNLGTVRGGVPVAHGPARRAGTPHTWGSPATPSEVAMEGLHGTAASPARGGDTFTVTGTVANLSGPTGPRRQRRADPARGVDGDAVQPHHHRDPGAGASQTVSWSVTIPDDATQGSYAVAAIVSYQQGQSTADHRRLLQPQRHPQGPCLHQ